jgi:cell wall-associated NlpC family hydrolase
MEDNLKNMPFIKIPLDKIQVNDFILYNLEGTKYINHCGIYKGNRVIHHLYNEISRLLPVIEYHNFAQMAVRFDREKCND